MVKSGDENITGRIPLDREKRELIVCLVFIFPVEGQLARCIVLTVNEEGEDGGEVLFGRGTAKG